MGLTNHIHGVSTRCVSIKAENMRVGDYRLWNGGSRTRLVAIKPVGKTMVQHTYECDNNDLSINCPNCGKGGCNRPDIRKMKRSTAITGFADSETLNFLSMEDRSESQL